MATTGKKLFELAELVGGEVVGNPDTVIYGLGDISTAQWNEIAFITKTGRNDAIAASKAAAVIVPLEITESDKPLIRVKDPNLAATILHQQFVYKPFAASGIHDKAVIGRDCLIPQEVSIGPLTVVGDRVTLGERVTLHAGVVIGNDIAIGDDTILYPNVTIYDNCRLGSRIIIHSGTVIGSDGFGYATDPNGRHVKRPHVGIVQIDDDVEIGSNVSVDRGTFGKTWIKQGAKIDNLVQIAHNVVIGEGSIIVSQVGIAGSTSLGRGVILGGQVGLKGHIHLNDGVMVASKSGVHANVDKGKIVSGIPAISHRDWLKASTIFAKLPQLFQEIRQLKKAVAAMQEGRNE
jgi:UDP-3-O-[3-hydroxymyristoyl] glucosamine N-acyltransferase